MLKLWCISFTDGSHCGWEMELSIPGLAVGLHALLLVMEDPLVVGPCALEKSENSQALVSRRLGL